MSLAKKQKYAWDEFEEDVLKLVKEIKRLRKKFDGIYGIPRGGLLLAVTLSHHLNLPILIGGVTKNTLVIDDVSDTGSMLVPFKERKATIVTIFYKPWSKVEPDIWLRKTKNHVVFPWEKI